MLAPAEQHAAAAQPDHPPTHPPHCELLCKQLCYTRRRKRMKGIWDLSSPIHPHSFSEYILHLSLKERKQHTKIKTLKYFRYLIFLCVICEICHAHQLLCKCAQRRSHNCRLDTERRHTLRESVVEWRLC